MTRIGKRPLEVMSSRIQCGILYGGFASTALASAGSQDGTLAGTSSTMLQMPGAPREIARDPRLLRRRQFAETPVILELVDLAEHASRFPDLDWR